LLWFNDLIKIEGNFNYGNEGFVLKMKTCYDKYMENKVNIGKNAAEKHANNMIGMFENMWLSLLNYGWKLENN